MQNRNTARAPPPRIAQAGRGKNREVICSYRYKKNSVWISLMSVYMARDGKGVTPSHPAPDPIYDDARFRGR
ncbi:hypothetical protein [Achromobacter dolens]|uniref:hypothetical protein n=1 Tax=Achromobacter dolens TaxID=1287738 RepID=UPI000A8CD35C|nr:hypothetical protein [Achromobacter dolens]